METPHGSYDPVAEEYARRFLHELDHKPFDCALLDRFANRLAGKGIVCDLGCGPGHVAQYLKERGVDVCGIDLSAALVEIARREHPGIPFEQGDMRSLSADNETWAGIVAFYSLIHIPPPDMTDTLRALARILQPGGLLLLSFHVGETSIHLDEWWDKPVSLDFHFFTVAQMRVYLASAGFTVEEAHKRSPYEPFEHPTRRAYVLARKEFP